MVVMLKKISFELICANEILKGTNIICVSFIDFFRNFYFQARYKYVK